MRDLVAVSRAPLSHANAPTLCDVAHRVAARQGTVLGRPRSCLVRAPACSAPRQAHQAHPQGKYCLGITLGVGFAAINTGNNLLYLLLGMLLSLIVVSGVMSDLSLRGLSVRRRLPTRAQVGRAHLVEIEVFNQKKRVPSFAIEVEDLRAGQPADKRCFFLKISPASAQVAAYRRTPLRRGRDRHTGFRIATRFPFGLFEKAREVPSEGELIIYPAVDPLRSLPHASSDADLEQCRLADAGAATRHTPCVRCAKGRSSRYLLAQEHAWRSAGHSRANERDEP